MTDPWPGPPDHTAWRWNDDASGTPVLALHGFTGSGADWAPIATGLGVPVLAPDLLGHGDSPAPLDAEAYAMDRVVEQVLAWCGPSSAWSVLGYSMGGRVALRLALRLGPRLRRLALVGASPGIEDAAARHERAERDAALADAIEARGMAWFVEHWAAHPVIRSQQTIPPAIRDPMTARRRRNRPAGLAGSLRGMGQGSVLPVWDRLPTLAVPTLWVTGREDATYTAYAERAARCQPHADHLCIDGVGHSAHLEAVDRVLPALVSFFNFD
jgi:2-succinyl-6-hydroxy-2,4-cyclohexadiene-1-carboxylate synthase